MSVDPKTALDAARTAADLLLALSELSGASPIDLIDEAAVRRANAIADVVEDAKFGPEGPG